MLQIITFVSREPGVRFADDLADERNMLRHMLGFVNAARSIRARRPRSLGLLPNIVGGAP